MAAFGAMLAPGVLVVGPFASTARRSILGDPKEAFVGGGAVFFCSSAMASFRSSGSRGSQLYGIGDKNNNKKESLGDTGVAKQNTKVCHRDTATPVHTISPRPGPPLKHYVWLTLCSSLYSIFGAPSSNFT
jgi:hypothetical protein